MIEFEAWLYLDLEILFPFQMLSILSVPCNLIVAFTAVFPHFSRHLRYFCKLETVLSTWNKKLKYWGFGQTLAGNNCLSLPRE